MIAPSAFSLMLVLSSVMSVAISFTSLTVITNASLYAKPVPA